MRAWAILVGICAIGCSGGTPGASGPIETDIGTLQVFPPDNPWNTDISAAAVDPMSAVYIASIGADLGLHPCFGASTEGIPYAVVAGTQPLVPVSFTGYPTESDPGPYPIPDNAPIEQGGDAHVIVVDRDHAELYELFAAAHASSGWTASNGAKWDLTSNAGRPAGETSADAAGLPIFAGLARYDEIVGKGTLTHALRFTVPKTQAAYVAPASHFASTRTDASLPPMGLRLRLKASFDVSSFPSEVQVILNGLKKYGMIVADNGSSWFITGAPDPRWSDDDLHTLGRVHGSDFEVVAHGPLVTK